MKAGWTTTPLDEACTFINGLWKGEKDPLKTVGVIRNTNFTKDGALDDTDIAFIEVEVKKFEKRKLFAGDIILEKSGGGPKQAVGRVVLFNKPEGDYSFSNFTAAIRVKSPDVLDAKYLHKFLHWTYLSGVTEEMQSNSTGIRNLDGDKYKAIQVSYPSIAEQHLIVTLLDGAFANIATAKANAEKNLQNARELFDNALQSLVDDASSNWTHRTMADVCDITSKLVDPREDQYLDLPHVGAGNIESKTSALVDVKTAREENLISGKFLFDESMVLYSKIRPYLMKVVRPDFNGLCSADIYPLAPKTGVITRNYLYYLLLAPAFTEYAIKGSARAGMPKVNREHLFAYQFGLPTVQEQKRISENLDQIANETQRLESIYRQKLTALDDLKKSLLHQAFSGQL